MNNGAATYQKDIVLFTDELLQDIRNAGYIQSGSKEEKDLKGKNKLQDVAELNNHEAVTRWMDLAVGAVTEILTPYSFGWIKRDKSLLTDRYTERDCYVVSLKFKNNFPQTTFAFLRTLCHEFVVAWVMRYYTRLADPESSRVWEQNIAELEEKITSAKNKASKVTLRKLYPFA